MTVENIKNEKIKLEKQIEKLIDDFEEKTKSVVTDIDISTDYYRSTQGMHKSKNIIRLKVEI